MLSPQTYLNANSMPFDFRSEPTPMSPSMYGSYTKQPQKLIGAHSVPSMQYVHSNDRPFVPTTNDANSELGLNLNEYLPTAVATSRVTNALLAPYMSKMTGFKKSDYKMIAQRAR
jgi:hypothetical protein